MARWWPGSFPSQCRGADAVYLVVAKRLAIPLVTWDREQIERGRGVTRVVRPRSSPASPT